MKRRRSIINNDYPFHLNIERHEIIQKCLVKFYLFVKYIFREFPIELIQFIVLKLKLKCSSLKCDTEYYFSNNKEFDICDNCFKTSKNLNFKGILCHKHEPILTVCIICKYNACSYHYEVLKGYICDFCHGHVCWACSKIHINEIESKYSYNNHLICSDCSKGYFKKRINKFYKNLL